MPQQNMEEKPSAPNATTLDISERNALSTNAPTATSCDPNTTKIDASTTLNTWDQTPSNKNLHLHPLSEFPLQKLSKNHASPPIDKAATPLPRQMESKREDARERNPNGRDSEITLIEVFPNNSWKWMKNMTKNSRTSLSFLTTRSNTTTPHTTTSMESQVTLKISKISNGISNVTRGVMLWFSLTCTISHPHYSSLLSHQTIPITTDY